MESGRGICTMQSRSSHARGTGSGSARYDRGVRRSWFGGSPDIVAGWTGKGTGERGAVESRKPLPHTPLPPGAGRGQRRRARGASLARVLVGAGTKAAGSSGFAGEAFMRRMPIASFIVAIALAVLPPLEQAHCAAMAAASTAPVPAAGACSRHACCALAPSHAPAQGAVPADTPPCHGCQQLPSVTLPAALAVDAGGMSTPCVAIGIDASLTAPVALADPAAHAAEIRTPHPPDDPGAHGLRAPPRLA